MMRSILCASICALIACLGGCGGGGGGTATSSAGGPPTADPPPASQASAPSITTQPASVSLQANQAASCARYLPMRTRICVGIPGLA